MLWDDEVVGKKGIGGLDYHIKYLKSRSDSPSMLIVIASISLIGILGEHIVFNLIEKKMANGR